MPDGGERPTAAAFDVIVVGGGPAGAATAIALARRGLRAAIVERHGAPRPRVGETLPPSAREPLEALGVWARFLQDGHGPAAGNRSSWGSGQLEEVHFIRSPYGHGWHLDRARFEAMLLEVAEGSGVTLVRGAGLDAASYDGSRWRVHAGRPLEARFAVDASGRSSLLARACGAERVSIDRLVGVTLFLEARDGGGDPEGPFTLIEAAEDGWWYSAPLPGGRLVVSCMTDGDLAARASLREREGWLAAAGRARATWQRLGAYALPGGPPRLGSANTARLDSVAGPAWLAAGDAAVSFDPLSSQGIVTALESGVDAAEAIDAHLAGEAAALPRYAALVSARYRDYLVERARYYGAERRWPDAPFWQRRQGHRSRSPGPLRRLGIAAALLGALAAGAADRHPLDAALVDETGRAVRFHDDVLQGRVVAINFIFTRCKTICLPMSGTFARVEALLGDRRARLVSISLDPDNDTPARLAEWKKRFGGGAAWTLLTGSKEEIDRLGKALGAFTPDRSNHTPTVIVLDGRSGRTTRVNGLASAQAIVKAIHDVSSPGPESPP